MWKRRTVISTYRTVIRTQGGPARRPRPPRQPPSALPPSARRTRLGRIAAVVAAVGLGLGLTACGGSEAASGGPTPSSAFRTLATVMGDVRIQGAPHRVVVLD